MWLLHQTSVQTTDYKHESVFNIFIVRFFIKGTSNHARLIALQESKNELLAFRRRRGFKIYVIRIHKRDFSCHWREKSKREFWFSFGWLHFHRKRQTPLVTWFFVFRIPIQIVYYYLYHIITIITKALCQQLTTEQCLLTKANNLSPKFSTLACFNGKQ